jgi:hypothetical protein
MYTNYKHLVTDSLPWWHRNGFTKASADAIWAKMQSSGFQPAAEELLSLKLPGYFIDCKCSPTSVVGGGPAEDGANAARWDVDVNRAFYNGWKSVHGLKHQTGKYFVVVIWHILTEVLYCYVYFACTFIVKICYNGGKLCQFFLFIS